MIGEGVRVQSQDLVLVAGKITGEGKNKYRMADQLGGC